MALLSCRRWARWSAAALLVVVAAVAGALTPVSGLSCSGLGAGGEFHPVPVSRIYDSRPGSAIGAPTGARPVTPEGVTFTLPVLGQAGVPSSPSSVLAVVANVTVAGATVPGYLTVHRPGAPAPNASNVNFSSAHAVPDLALLPVDASGQVAFTLVGLGTGTAHVLVDVFGFVSSSCHATRGARLVALAPTRIVDTRAAAPLAAGQVLTVPFRGADGVSPVQHDVVPNDPNVVGAVVNLTVVNQLPTSTMTFLSVLPEHPAGFPSTSTTNLAPGQVKANLAIVPVGADGAIRVYNEQGNAHVIIDVVGYLINGAPVTTRDGRIVPLDNPYRAVETRPIPLGPRQSEDWDFAPFVSSIKVNGAPVGDVTALLGNLTATNLRRQYATVPVETYLTVYPTGMPLPYASNINVREREDVPNFAVVRLSGADQATVYNAVGFADYLFDVAAVVLGS